MSATHPDLRAVIAGIVREVLADLAVVPAVTGASRATGAVAPAGTSTRPTASGVVPEDVSPPRSAGRTEAVRITDDTDLDRFARRLLTLFENPKSRQDLRAGRLRFRLEGGTVAVPADRPVHRVETGAVTERRVTAVAQAGQRLVLGRRAVLTPLGRERARALGVPIEKER